ncbi:MAG: DNA-directed RNA polymerase subunit omega [Bacteroidota bacterium]
MKQSITLTSRNFLELMAPTGNIYETTVIISKRAKQLVTETKAELDVKFAEFASHTDNNNHLEEISENKERIEISKSYEKQPKPAILATEEFLAGKIAGRYLD